MRRVAILFRLGAFALVYFSFVSLLLAGGPPDVDLAGKITAVSGKTITIRLNSTNVSPRVGDPVDVSFTTPDGEKVPVGSWKVSKVEGAMVEATVIDSQGDPYPDMDAVIHSSLAASRPDIPASDHPAGYIPALKAVLSHMCFYASSTVQSVPPKERVFQSTFAPGTRNIWWQFTLSYSPSQRVDFDVMSRVYRPDGSLFKTRTDHFYIDPTTTSVDYSAGWYPEGGWPPGTYIVEIVFQNHRIASGGFTVQ